MNYLLIMILLTNAGTGPVGLAYQTATFQSVKLRQDVVEATQRTAKKPWGFKVVAIKFFYQRGKG